MYIIIIIIISDDSNIRDLYVLPLWSKQLRGTYGYTHTDTHVYMCMYVCIYIREPIYMYVCILELNLSRFSKADRA